MGNRRALLIGASDYEAPGIASLPFVLADMTALGEALERRGFEVTIPTAKRQVGVNFVNVEMGRFLKKARSGDTLLACLSGHGVHAEGQDYFVPEDAHPEIEPFEEGCVAIDWKRDVERSLAEHIVILVDACREGIERDSKSLNAINGWSRRRADRELRRKLAYVYACSAGQVARFITPADRIQDGLDCGIREGESFSIFSRALRDVFLSHPGALHLADLRDHVQDRVEELHRAYGKVNALQQMRVVMNASGEPADFPIAPPIEPTEETDGVLTAPVPSVDEAAPPAAAGSGVMSTLTDAYAGTRSETEPTLRLARALYRFQAHGDMGPLLDFAADGPATNVVQLVGVVPEHVRGRIWETCVRRRPAVALHELRRVLRADGDAALEQSLLGRALTSRPREVLQALDPAEARDILDSTARIRPAPDVVELLEALHRDGMASEAGRLLYRAAHRSFDQLPALLGALRAAGLMRAATHVLVHHGRHCPAADLPAFVDAVGSDGRVGRRADLEQVVQAVARRPAPDLAPCLRALRGAGRDPVAAATLSSAASQSPDAVVRLARDLLRAGDEEDATGLLSAAAEGMSMSCFADLVRLECEDSAMSSSAVRWWKGTRGRSLTLHMPWDHLVRVRSGQELVELVRALCSRWLDTEVRSVLAQLPRHRSHAELPALLASLTGSGHDRECRYLLETVAREHSPAEVRAVYTELRDVGQSAWARDLVRLVLDLRQPDSTAGVFDALREAGAESEIAEAVSASFADPRRPVEALLRSMLVVGADGTAPGSASAIRTVFVQRDVEDVARLLTGLPGDYQAGALVPWRVLVDERSVVELARLILAMHAAEITGHWREMAALAGARRSIADLGVLITTLHEGGAEDAVPVLRNMVARSRNAEDISAFVRWLRSVARTEDVASVFALVGEQRRIDMVAALVKQLADEGETETALALTDLAAECRPWDQTVGLAVALLDAGAETAAHRMLEHLARDHPVRPTLEVIRLLREDARDDVVQQVLRAVARLGTLDATLNLVEDLHQAGFSHEADTAIGAIGIVCDPAVVARFLTEGRRDRGHGTRMRDSELVLESAARHRSGTDLLAVVGGVPVSMREQVLESVGAYSPFPTLVGIVGAELTSWRSSGLELLALLKAAFEQGRHDDLAALLRQTDIGGEAVAEADRRSRGYRPVRDLRKIIVLALRDFLPTVLVRWARALAEAGLDADAAAALHDAVARPAAELARLFEVAQRVRWEEDEQELLEQAVLRRGPKVLADAWTAEFPGDEAALRRAIGRVPLQILAAEAPASNWTEWAMRGCPSAELIPALVDAIGKRSALDENLLSAFCSTRGAGDLAHLLRELRAVGRQDRVQEVVALLVRRATVGGVAELVSDMHASVTHDETDQFLSALTCTNLPQPALIAELSRRGLTDLADRTRRLVVESPPHYARLPDYATRLLRYGLEKEAREIVEAYGLRCPDGTLVQAVRRLDREDASQLRVVLLTHIALHRDEPVLRHVLTELRREGRTEAAGELLARAEHHRPLAEVLALRAAVAAVVSRGAPDPPPPAPRKRPFGIFRRSG
ncbi:caspase family protein [Streptomyces sp. DSM 3412]|uniref:Caspase family protein n=1 Tax=Streptomyces gottesmaniae TaxID=3075518 RepID=A0ABU2ZDE3_9ACTN|nr:caspase family protein [Streptomyces sp. DSM 3412]MDT0573629.1 caspase family protein [Streptomyces sp. DSM 3412]